jgi:hypothetical protein
MGFRGYTGVTDQGIKDTGSLSFFSASGNGFSISAVGPWPNAGVTGMSQPPRHPITSKVMTFFTIRRLISNPCRSIPIFSF